MGDFFEGRTIPGMFYRVGGGGTPKPPPHVPILEPRGTGGTLREGMDGEGVVSGVGLRSAQIGNSPRTLSMGRIFSMVEK